MQEEDVFALTPKSIKKYKEMKKNTKFYFLQIKKISDGKLLFEKMYEIILAAKYKTKEKKYFIYTNLQEWKPGKNLGLAIMQSNAVSINEFDKQSFIKRKEWFVGHELVKKILCQGNMYYFLENVLKLNKKDRDIYIKKTRIFANDIE